MRLVLVGLVIAKILTIFVEIFVTAQLQTSQ